MLKNILLSIALMFTITLTAQQETFELIETFSITYNEFSDSSDIRDEWCGTQTLKYVRTRILLTYCMDCVTPVIEEGYIVYRKYYNLHNPDEVYWDIDHFTNRYNDRYKLGSNILGFKQNN